MGKRVRLLSSSLAVGALVASVFIGALSAQATSAAPPPIQIGVDNAGPTGHNFEYVDFFPRSAAVIHNGDIVDFAWNPAALDGFHTVTFVPLHRTPEQVWQQHPAFKPDADDGAGSLQFNAELFSNQPHSCLGDSVAHACSFDGFNHVSSAGLANPQNGGPHFFVKVNLNLDELETSLPAQVKFICLIHPGMQGSLTVAPGAEPAASGEAPTAISTQASLDAASATQLAADTADALAAEAAVTTKSEFSLNDGRHTITMTAGTATNYVEVLEMLPSSVQIQPGDHVKWVTAAKKDPHTVTFPQGSGSDALDPFGAPVCEGSGTTDTPATAGPPTFGCGEATPEAPLNWMASGDPVIKTTSTAATSGVIATFEQAPFPNNYTFTFPNAGTFAYVCRIHEHMVGSIVVAAPTVVAPPPVLAQTGGGLPWRSLALVLGALAVLLGLAALRLRSLVRL